MQLAYPRVSEHLQRSLKPLYFVSGAEILLVQETVDAIRAKARQSGYTERQSFSVIQAGFDWDEVQNAANSLSLFADKQIIEVYIPSGKPGREGSSALERLASSVQASDSTLLLVVVPIECDSSTKKTAWFKALSDFGVAIHVPQITRAQLGPWIEQRMAAVTPRALQLPSGTEGERILQFLVDQLEGNVLAAHQEISKLALAYAQRADAVLDYASVERSVLHVARYDAQQLTEAMLLGKAERAHTILQGLRAEGAEIVMLSWHIGETMRQLRALWQAGQQGLPRAQVLRELRVWGPREEWLSSAVPKMHAALVMRLLHGAWILDGISKGILHPDWPGDPWTALAQLVQQCISGLYPQAAVKPRGVKPQGVRA